MSVITLDCGSKFVPSFSKPDSLLMEAVFDVTFGGEYNNILSSFCGFPVFVADSEEFTRYASCSAVSVNGSFEPFICISNYVINLLGGLDSSLVFAVILHEVGHLVNGDVGTDARDILEYVRKERAADGYAVRLGYGRSLAEALSALYPDGCIPSIVMNRIKVINESP